MLHEGALVLEDTDPLAATKGLRAVLTLQIGQVPQTGQVVSPGLSQPALPAIAAR
jgi:hypothetical protein